MPIWVFVCRQTYEYIPHICRCTHMHNYVHVYIEKIYTFVYIYICIMHTHTIYICIILEYMFCKYAWSTCKIITLPHLAMPEVYFSSGPASMPQEMGPRLKISFIMAACRTPDILWSKPPVRIHTFEFKWFLCYTYVWLVVWTPLKNIIQWEGYSQYMGK